MTDIVERLKRGHQGSGIGPLDCHDAVQEIEQLRKSIGRTDHTKKAVAALKIEQELCAENLAAASSALLKLVEYGVPPDIQELLVHGSKRAGVRPGALVAALSAALGVYQQFPKTEG